MIDIYKKLHKTMVVSNMPISLLMFLLDMNLIPLSCLLAELSGTKLVTRIRQK